MGGTVTDLDDTLRHQVPLTFNQVATSDHRFTDRHWYTTFAPDGSASLIIGWGAYPNMNVMDAYASVVVHHDEQLNLRASRLLRPRIEETAVGPIAHQVLAPHRTAQLTVGENESGIALDLTFEASNPPRLEVPHRTIHEGHLAEDYLRINQGGTCRGRISVGDRTWEAHDWYAGKDHTWGVRGHFGGVTIVKGGEFVDDFAGMFLWVVWTSGPYDGYIQFKGDGSGAQRYTDGEITVSGEGPDRKVRIVLADHKIAFTGNSNIYTSIGLVLHGDNGEVFEVEVEPSHLPFAVHGTGYFDGFTDRRGLGAYRGDDMVEHDRYDLFADGWVRFPDGRRGKPWHRESACRTTCNGVDGFGYSSVMVEGRVERYELDLANRSRQGNGITWEDGAPDLAPGTAQGEAASSPPGRYPPPV